MANEYRIDSINDVRNIPEDRLDEFLVDLKIWVQVTNMTIDLARAIGDRDARAEGFIWVDDGKSDVTINIKTRQPEGNKDE